MLKKIVLFVFAFTLIFIIDQSMKYYTLNTLCASNEIINGTIYMQEGEELFPQNSCASKRQGEYISLVGTLNTGVAFSMFSGSEQLKYIHLGLLLVLFAYLLWQRRFFSDHLIAFGLLFGAGFSNLFDRFVYGGVVDMFFWHKWFEFAVFNVADATINLSVAIILIKEIFSRKKRKNEWNLD